MQASKDLTAGSRIEEGGGEKLENILEHMVTFRDVPAMKDLLTTQKKIRNLLDDWLSYCRTQLHIMSPKMYILPELAPLKRTGVRRRGHAISPDRKRSRSAEVMGSSLDFHSAVESPIRNTIRYFPDIRTRSKSAFIGKSFKQMRFLTFLLLMRFIGDVFLRKQSPLARLILTSNLINVYITFKCHRYSLITTGQSLLYYYFS